MYYSDGWFINPKKTEHIQLDKQGKICSYYYNYSCCPIEHKSDEEYRMWLFTNGFHRMSAADEAKFYLALER